MRILHHFTGRLPHGRPPESPLFLRAASSDDGGDDWPQEGAPAGAPVQWVRLESNGALIAAFASESDDWIATDALSESSFRKWPLLPPSWLEGSAARPIVTRSRVLRNICPGLHAIFEKYQLALLLGELDTERGIPSVAVAELGTVRDMAGSTVAESWIVKSASSHRGRGLEVFESKDAALRHLFSSHRLDPDRRAEREEEGGVPAVASSRVLEDRYVVQPLVPHPVLADGSYKVDLRIWAGLLFGTRSRGCTCKAGDQDAEPSEDPELDLFGDGDTLPVELGHEADGSKWFELWIASHGLCRIAGFPHPSRNGGRATTQLLLRSEVTNYALQMEWLAEAGDSVPEGTRDPMVVPFTPSDHPKELPHGTVFPMISSCVYSLVEALISRDRLNRFEVAGATLLGLDILVSHPPGGPFGVHLLEANLAPSSWRNVPGAEAVADRVLCLSGWGALIARTAVLCEGDSPPEPRSLSGGWHRIGAWR
ncbi:hypothetical protein DFJ74DRAFT_378742 [Hyaloraphidium curvatum]|nr:hypothetical protein DFJ74DRAFT_378742 [Hyaloraphidium curvatum]